MTEILGLFRRNPDEDRLLSLISSSVAAQAATAEEATNIQDVLAKRPLVRWFVLRQVKGELVAAGLWGATAINWDAIADFIVKIAPIIFEIISLFL